MEKNQTAINYDMKIGNEKFNNQREDKEMKKDKS